jgi:hypothetical protein
MSLLDDVWDVATEPIDLVFEGLEKTYDELNDSTLGQAVMLGAAIYFGGVAAGWWDAPALLGGERAGSELAAESLAGEAGGLTAEQIAADASTTGLIDSGGAVAAGAEPAAADATATALADSTAANTTSLGTIPQTPDLAAAAPNTMGTGAGPITNSGLANGAANPNNASWLDNPFVQYGLIQTGAGLIQGAMAPDQIDVLQEQAALQQQAEAERIARKNQSAMVGNISLGKPSKKPLLRPDGTPVYPNPYTPTGLIQGAVS